MRERCGCSVNTAQNAISDLEGAGILREVTQKRRNRVWMAHEILDVLTGRRVPEETEMFPGGAQAGGEVSA